ncbi:MAG: GspH/FimT family pseudopilin [Halobacteriales archaeon]|nr:GspH/FimT family pseudopilin [Halobacteriales archaeon]
MIRSPRQPNSPRASGFTLLEVMIAVTVLALLLTIMGPQIMQMSNRMEANAAAQQVLGDLERARTEAIKRNTTVSLKKTGDSTYSIQFVGSRALDGAVFASAPDSVAFAAYGPPTLGGETFVVQAGAHTKTVVLNAAGHAKVQ